jgi:hypothetical protein
MLTKQDLNAIGEIVDIKLEKRLKPIQQDIKKLRKDLDKTIDFFDKANLSTRKGVNKTRKDLGLNEVNFAY